MGLPIPHTAILPNNKGRVAESIAGFLEKNFLTEDQLGPRFRGIDYAGFITGWLENHAAMLAQNAADFAPNIVSGFSDDEMSALLGDRARDLICNAEFGPLAGAGLEVIVQNGRDREIFISVLGSVKQIIEDNRGAIQATIRKEIPLSADLLGSVPFLKELAGPLLEQVRDSIASAVAGKTIEKVQSALEEAGSGPNHPLFTSFDQHLRRFIADLKSSPEMACKIRSMQEALSKSQFVADFAARTWQEVKNFILRDCSSADSTVRRKIEDAIRLASCQLAENRKAKTEINTFLGGQVLAAILAARPHARDIVTSTISAWDANEMADKLESAVGRDLQFIRLNGTLVGGIVGVVIYATLKWIAPIC